MQIHIAGEELLARIVHRKRRIRPVGSEVNLVAVMQEVLTRAGEFIPSDAGSILFDDPRLKLKDEEGRLYFVACFGEDSLPLVGTSMSVRVGIAGDTYRSGRPYISEDVANDELFYREIREKTRFDVRSLICAPIAIHGSVIGVIQLINKKGDVRFDSKDLALLEIFAGYTSTLMQNTLDARRFEELSKRDNLTGLFNDRYFLERLPWEVGTAQKDGGDLSLIFFDLDRFKEVNDTWGHLTGSQVLREVAVLVREVFCGFEAVSARYGGDEFVVILPGISLEEAGFLAGRLRERIADNVYVREGLSHGGPPLDIAGIITASIGVASLSESIERDGEAMEEVGQLIKAADAAMYRAKEAGKNRVVLAGEKKTEKSGIR